jgi:protein O-mannosyl-transferase
MQQVPAFRIHWAWSLLPLALLTVWIGALSGPFQFDDWNVIVEQPAVHSLSAWWQSMPGMRPLLKLSYALNWESPAEATGYHLTNLLIHLFNVVLVWRLLTGWPARNAGSDRPGLERNAIFWITLIFALHPVQTEAVTYISGRSMSLMSTGLLIALLSWVQADRRHSAAWLWVAVFAFAAAMGVRETAWSFPLVLLVWERAQGVAWREGVRKLWLFWLVLVTAGLGMMTLPAYRKMLIHSLETRSPLDNLALQVDALAYLFTRPLLLLQNNIDPELPSVATFDLAWGIGAATIIGMLLLGFRWLAVRPWAGLALLWPFLFLLPTNGLLARFDPASERHLYLALIGPAVLLVNGVLRWCRQPRRPFIVHVVLLLVCVTLAVATIKRNADYRSESALWRVTAERSPNKPRVWNNLGYAHLVEGRPDLAKPAFERALELDPGFVRARLNLERSQGLPDDQVVIRIR